jgi:glycerol kinase
MTKKYVMAFDAGTASNRAILFDHAGQIVSVGSRSLPKSTPSPAG